MSYDPNAKLNQAGKGGVTAIPHPFHVHSSGGGRDSSDSVFKRIFQNMRRSFTPYVDTVNNQPTAGAKTNAYMGHYIGATTFIGRNAIACGPAPNPYQPGMLYMPEQSFPVVGLGGLVNGEMLGQELIDMNDSPNF